MHNKKAVRQKGVGGCYDRVEEEEAKGREAGSADQRRRPRS
jgi:hypothetical protein